MTLCDIYSGRRLVAKDVKYCGTLGLRILGLMFVHSPGAGAFLPVTKDIHMNFVRFELRIIWLNKNFEVVEDKIAKKWRVYNGPKTAYNVLELPVTNKIKIKIGEKLKIKIHGPTKRKRDA